MSAPSVGSLLHPGYVRTRHRWARQIALVGHYRTRLPFACSDPVGNGIAHLHVEGSSEQTLMQHMSLRTKPNAPPDTITHAQRRSSVTPMPVDNRRLMTIGRPSKTVMHSYGAARRALPAQRALAGRHRSKRSLLVTSQIDAAPAGRLHPLVHKRGKPLAEYCRLRTTSKCRPPPPGRRNDRRRTACARDNGLQTPGECDRDSDRTRS